MGGNQVNNDGCRSNTWGDSKVAELNQIPSVCLDRRIFVKAAYDSAVNADPFRIVKDSAQLNVRERISPELEMSNLPCLRVKLVSFDFAVWQVDG